MDFHSMSIGSSPLCSIYDFAAKLVKASDCNSEGVSSTLTEIFSYGKPDVKTYFLDAYETYVCKLNTYYRPIKLSVGNNYADYSDKVVMKIVSFSLEKDNFLRKSHFMRDGSFVYTPLA